MTTEELLRPRYKVIADYPNSPHKIYEILESINVDGRYLNKNIGLWEKDLEKFPAIFKPLEWWEDRKAEDMPEYLKHKLKDSPTTYHKIIKWNMVQMVGYENEKRIVQNLLKNIAIKFLCIRFDDHRQPHDQK